MSSQRPDQAARSAFSSPSALASKRLGNHLGPRPLSPTGSDVSVYSTRSRRSQSMIQCSESAEVFDQIHSATGIRVSARARKMRPPSPAQPPLSPNSSLAESVMLSISPTVDSVVRAVSPAVDTMLQSMSQAGLTSGPEVVVPQRSQVQIKGDEFYYSGSQDAGDYFRKDNAQIKSAMDFKRNDNAFHVMADILVEFFRKRVRRDVIIINAADSEPIERLLPPSARRSFIEALQYRLSQTPIKPRNPLERLALQCKELGLNRDGPQNPIIAASMADDDDNTTVHLPVVSLLKDDDGAGDASKPVIVNLEHAEEEPVIIVREEPKRGPPTSAVTRSVAPRKASPTLDPNHMSTNADMVVNARSPSPEDLVMEARSPSPDMVVNARTASPVQPMLVVARAPSPEMHFPPPRIEHTTTEGDLLVVESSLSAPSRVDESVLDKPIEVPSQPATRYTIRSTPTPSEQSVMDPPVEVPYEPQRSYAIRSTPTPSEQSVMQPPVEVPYESQRSYAIRSTPTPSEQSVMQPPVEVPYEPQRSYAIRSTPTPSEQSVMQPPVEVPYESQRSNAIRSTPTPSEQSVTYRSEPNYSIQSTPPPDEEPEMVIEKKSSFDFPLPSSTDNIAKKTILMELHEAHQLMKSSSAPESVNFWLSHIEDLKARLNALTGTTRESTAPLIASASIQSEPYTMTKPTKPIKPQPTIVDVPDTPAVEYSSGWYSPGKNYISSNATVSTMAPSIISTFADERSIVPPSTNTNPPSVIHHPAPAPQEPSLQPHTAALETPASVAGKVAPPTQLVPPPVQEPTAALTVPVPAPTPASVAATTPASVRAPTHAPTPAAVAQTVSPTSMETQASSVSVTAQAGDFASPKAAAEQDSKVTELVGNVAQQTRHQQLEQPEEATDGALPPTPQPQQQQQQGEGQNQSYVPPSSPYVPPSSPSLNQHNEPVKPTPNYDAPMVDVVAPADLPGGYNFEAEIEGQRFLATVPAGGVQEGETFTCYMTQLDSMAIDIPVGYWKDSPKDILKYGCCHPVVWTSFFCPLLGLSQIQHRTNLDFLGRPRVVVTTPNRIMMFTIMTFWVGMNVLLFLGYNIKWSRGMELTVADWASCALINGAYVGFIVFVTQSTRSSLRDKFLIREQRCNDLEDVICATWCLPCTVAQMSRHTANYDDYEAVCCSKSGLPDGVQVNQKAQQTGSYMV